MTESEKQEINKTITEFMGYIIKDGVAYSPEKTVCGEETYDEILIKRDANFTESLDLLLPVWRDIDKHITGRVQPWTFLRLSLFAKMLQSDAVEIMKERADDMTIQQAAAKATAEAIKKLKN